MPGDAWQKFANLRLLYAYLWAQPGKKLLFMGGELGQWREWNHESSLDWHLAEGEPRHAQLQRLVGELNRLYRERPPLHQLDCGPGGFEWVDADDSLNSVFSFLRRDKAGRIVLAVFNCTPVPRNHYRLGVSLPGEWRELLNTDAVDFGGSGWGNLGTVTAEPTPHHGRPCSLSLTLPPLAALYLEPQGER